MRLLPFPSSHVGSAWCVLAALVAGAEPVAVRSVESIPVPSSETRSAVLFLGSELKIKDEAGQWRQISAADGKSFATLLPGEAAIRVELAAGAFEFTYERALKLAAGRVEISNFEVTPGFSAARDPGRRWLQSQSLAASGVMDQERSANLRAGAEVVVGRSLQAVATNPNLSSSQKDQSMREIEGSAAPQTSVDPTIPRLEMGNHPGFDRAHHRFPGKLDEQAGALPATTRPPLWALNNEIKRDV